jgi:23S rRNA (pseudouridine1915-N3)-methyltransferase
MQFDVIAVGRVRDAALRAACDEYLSRTRRYLKVQEHEVPAARARRPADVRKLEGERLLERLSPRCRGVALTRVGTALPSRAFAERLGAWRREARDVALLIGGADGLDGPVLERCETHLSLSAMTLPHELARVVLYEQLYRSCTILGGEPYHKGT